MRVFESSFTAVHEELPKCMPVLPARGNRESDGVNSPQIAGSNPALHPVMMYASGLVAVQSGKRMRPWAQMKTAFVIRQRMCKASSDAEDIPSNAYPALSEIGYRAWDQKARKQFSADWIPTLKVSAAEWAWITNHDF